MLARAWFCLRIGALCVGNQRLAGKVMAILSIVGMEAKLLIINRSEMLMAARVNIL